jgi:hypothetical protein
MSDEGHPEGYYWARFEGVEPFIIWHVAGRWSTCGTSDDYAFYPPGLELLAGPLSPSAPPGLETPAAIVCALVADFEAEDRLEGKCYRASVEVAKAWLKGIVP